MAEHRHLKTIGKEVHNAETQNKVKATWVPDSPREAFPQSGRYAGADASGSRRRCESENFFLYWLALPSKRSLDYFKEILWDESLAQDRFFGYADASLVDQVRTAAAQGVFAPS